MATGLLMMCSVILGQASLPAPTGLTASPSLEVPTVGADLIPSPPRLPAGLPDPVMQPDGTLLPKPLDAAVADLLSYCQEGYPRVCSTAIGQARIVEQVVCDGRVAVLSAQCQAGKLKQAVDAGATWPVWKVVGMVGIAVVVGMGAGYGLGRVLP